MYVKPKYLCNIEPILDHIPLVLYLTALNTSDPILFPHICYIFKSPTVETLYSAPE